MFTTLRLARSHIGMGSARGSCARSGVSNQPLRLIMSLLLLKTRTARERRVNSKRTKQRGAFRIIIIQPSVRMQCLRVRFPLLRQPQPHSVLACPAGNGPCARSSSSFDFRRQAVPERLVTGIHRSGLPGSASCFAGQQKSPAPAPDRTPIRPASVLSREHLKLLSLCCYAL